MSLEMRVPDGPADTPTPFPRRQHRWVARRGGASSRAVSTANVVLLHGQPGDRADWDEVVAQLPETLTVHALDRPGYGDNQTPAGSIEANARWLLDRLDRDGIDRAVLVGHSYGGIVALAAAALAPERVRGLVLIASVGPGCLTPFDELLAAPIAGPALSVTAWSLLPWLARKGLDRNPSRTAVPAAWHMLAGVHHRHGQVWRSFLIEQRELFHGLEQWTARLPEIAAPTLILADPADKVVPISTAHALSDQLPCARVELISEGGHHLPRRRPDVVAARIGEFVESLE